MPVADAPTTARAWATEPAIALWIIDLDGPLADVRPEVVVQVAALRATGVGAVTLPRDSAASPRAIAEAAWANGVDDLRRVGVVAATPEALDAAHRSGAAAVVGVVPDAAFDRRGLLGGQPDLITTLGRLSSTLDERFGPDRAHRQRVLLNPGPAVVTDRVHRAVGGPDLCHREPEATAILARVRTLLLEIAAAPAGWRAVLLAGSGTAAMEAMVRAAVRPGEALLCIRNGTYGDRMAMMAERAGIAHHEVAFAHTEPADPGRVAAALDTMPSVRAITVIQHETTTGLLNPITALAEMARTRGVRLVVDAISAFGSEELSLASGGIAMVAGTANKNLHGLPGVAFVLLSPEAQEVARAVAPTSVYLDLAAYLDAADRGSVPFTPSVPAIYGLQAALDELLDEGIASRRETYRQRIAWLDAELAHLGLEPVVEVDHRSASVRAYPLPPGVSYGELHDRLKAAGFVIYAGQGTGAAEQFRVCALGALTVDALRPFVTELATIVAAVPA